MRGRFSRWAVRSPRNLALVSAVAATLITLTAVTVSSWASSTSEVATQGGPQGTTESSPETMLLEPPEVSLEAPEISLEAPEITSAPVSEGERTDPQAEVVATAFVAAWLDTKDPDWPDVDGLVTGQLARTIETIDPANVPKGKVVDSEATVAGKFYQEVTVMIGKDKTVSVVLTLTGDGWRVLQILP